MTPAVRVSLAAALLVVAAVEVSSSAPAASNPNWRFQQASVGSAGQRAGSASGARFSLDGQPVVRGESLSSDGRYLAFSSAADLPVSGATPVRTSGQPTVYVRDRKAPGSTVAVAVSARGSAPTETPTPLVTGGSLSSASAAAAASDPGVLTLTPGSSAATRISVPVPAVPPSADIELAIDATGSMVSAIEAAKTSALTLVADIQKQVPDTRFAVVQFRDDPSLDIAPGTTPSEYDVLAPMTSDAAAISSAIGGISAVGGGDDPEAHNYLLSLAANPATGGAIGWRERARKIVIVISDAEPHGAGLPGPDGQTLAGCADTSDDPHGLRTPSVLSDLAIAGRSLYMVDVRTLAPPEGSTGDLLTCYSSIAKLAGGSAVAADPIGLETGIVSLVRNSFSRVDALTLGVSAAAPDPATPNWVTIDPTERDNLWPPTDAPFDLSVAVPTGTPEGTYTFTLQPKADGASLTPIPLTVVVQSAAVPAHPGGVSGEPSITADGRLVAFTSTAQLTDDAWTGTSVFVRNRSVNPAGPYDDPAGATTTLASGVPATGPSGEYAASAAEALAFQRRAGSPAISADGRTLAYVADLSPLSPALKFSAAGDSLHLAPPYAGAGAQAPASVWFPIDSEGEGWTAAPVYLTVSNTSDDVVSFVKPRITGPDAVAFGASGCSGTLAPGASCVIRLTFDPDAADGASVATLVLDGDTPAARTRLTLMGSTPVPCEGWCSAPDPFSDSRISAVGTAPTLIAPGGTATVTLTVPYEGDPDVVVRSTDPAAIAVSDPYVPPASGDRQRAVDVTLTPSGLGVLSALISLDGELYPVTVATAVSTIVVRTDGDGDGTFAGSGDPAPVLAVSRGMSAFPAAHPSLSGDGRYLAFDTPAALAAEGRADGDNTRTDVYVADLGNPSTFMWISRNPSADVGGTDPSISRSGSRVAYVIPAYEEGTVDHIGVVDWTLGSGLVLADSCAGECRTNYGASDPQLSGTGLSVVFQSSDSGLDPDAADTGGGSEGWVDDQVYVTDLPADLSAVAATPLAPRMVSAVTSEGDGVWPVGGDWPVVSANGRIVGFATEYALDDADGNGTTDVYTADRVPHLVLPDRVDLGSVGVGATRTPYVIHLGNTGQGALNVDRVSLAGADAAAFRIVQDDCSATSVEPSEECLVRVSVSPGARRSFAADLVVVSDDPTHPEATARLVAQGIAPEVTISPDPVDFGKVVIGTTTQRIITVANTGDDSYTITGSHIDGADASLFTVVPGSSACLADTAVVVPAGKTCSVLVEFAPKARASAQATLTLVGGPGQPVAATLTGRGTGADLRITPDPLAFDRQTVGTTSDPRVVVLKNAGDAAARITAWASVGAAAKDFTVERGDGARACPALPATVAVGASCTLAVTFTPTAPGERVAKLAVTLSTGLTRAVDVTGTAVAALLTAAPSPLPLTSPKVGVTGAPASVQITNGGTRPLRIATVNAKADSDGVFTVTGTTCPAAVLQAKDSCSVTLTYTPATDQGRTGTLTVTASDGTAVDVPLDGRVSGGAGTDIPVATLDVGPRVTPTDSVVVASGHFFPPSTTIRLSWNTGAGSGTVVTTTTVDGDLLVQVPILPRDSLGLRTLTATRVDGQPLLGAPITSPQLLVVLRTTQPGRFVFR